MSLSRAAELRGCDPGDVSSFLTVQRYEEGDVTIVRPLAHRMYTTMSSAIVAKVALYTQCVECDMCVGGGLRLAPRLDDRDGFANTCPLACVWQALRAMDSVFTLAKVEANRPALMNVLDWVQVTAEIHLGDVRLLPTSPFFPLCVPPSRTAWSGFGAHVVMRGAHPAVILPLPVRPLLETCRWRLCRLPLGSSASWQRRLVTWRPLSHTPCSCVGSRWGSTTR